MSNVYFTKETENYILEYNNTQDSDRKNFIFREHLYYPFFKLTENIIHTFKFYYMDVDKVEDLQHELIVMLMDKLEGFNPKKSVKDKLSEYTQSQSKIYEDCIEVIENIDDKIFNETHLKSLIERVKNHEDWDLLSKENQTFIKRINIPKAFSYFGTIVKNYLIIYNRDNYKIKQNKVRINNPESENDSIDEDKFEYVENTSENVENLSHFMKRYVDYCYSIINNLYTDPTDKKIADAILTIFKSSDNLNSDTIKKKVVYMYIREMVPDVKTPKITRVSNILKKIYKEEYIFFLENGYYRI